MLRLSGAPVRDQILSEERHRIQTLNAVRAPRLVVFLVGDDEASQIYVRQKELAAQSVGIESVVIRLPKTIELHAFREAVRHANEDPAVDGILIQRPVPLAVSSEELNFWISPSKDVDGSHPENLGRLLSQSGGHQACTPAGICALLDHYRFQFGGKHAVVLGRSLTVGLPVAQLLIQKNMTVTQCHRRTHLVEEHTRRADLVVVATGQRALLSASAFKRGAWLVDVGIHRTQDGKLVGDVDPVGLESVLDAASPVPGGVGPMTIALLIRNTVNAFVRGQV